MGTDLGFFEEEKKEEGGGRGDLPTEGYGRRKPSTRILIAQGGWVRFIGEKSRKKEGGAHW